MSIKNITISFKSVRQKFVRQFPPQPVLQVCFNYNKQTCVFLEIFVNKISIFRENDTGFSLNCTYSCHIFCAISRNHVLRRKTLLQYVFFCDYFILTCKTDFYFFELRGGSLSVSSWHESIYYKKKGCVSWNKNQAPAEKHG